MQVGVAQQWYDEIDHLTFTTSEGESRTAAETRGENRVVQEGRVCIDCTVSTSPGTSEVRLYSLCCSLVIFLSEAHNCTARSQVREQFHLPSTFRMVTSPNLSLLALWIIELILFQNLHLIFIIIQVIIYAPLYLRLKRSSSSSTDNRVEDAARIADIIDPLRKPARDSVIQFLLSSKRDLKDLIFVKPLHVRLKFDCGDHPKADNSKSVVLTASSIEVNVVALWDSSHFFTNQICLFIIIMSVISSSVNVFLVSTIRQESWNNCYHESRSFFNLVPRKL